MNCDSSSFSCLRDKPHLYEEEDILRLRRKENFHRLGRIREALSFIVSPKNSTEIPSYSNLTSSSFQCSIIKPDTDIAVDAYSTNGAPSPDIFSEEVRSSISAPSFSKLALGNHSTSDSTGWKKIQETGKNNGPLQREKYAFFHSSTEREENLSSLLWNSKQSSCSSPFTEKKDSQEGVIMSQKTVGESSLQKVALAAWKLFVAQNSSKSSSCFVYTHVDDCNDEKILNIIEEGGETVDYFVHALEEWRTRISHLSSKEEKTGMYEASKADQMKSDFVMQKESESEGEGHDFSAEDNLVKLHQNTKEMTDLWNSNHQDWIQKEESLTRTIACLEGELERLHAENQMFNASRTSLSLLNSEYIPSHSRKKRDESETLGLHYQLEVTERQCNDCALELNKVRKELEASEKKCAKYFQEVEDLKVSLGVSEKLLQDLEVQPSILIPDSIEREKNTKNSFRETFERQETLQEDGKVLKVSGQNGHDHFSLQLIKGSHLTCEVVNQLNHGLPKGMASPYLSCTTTENGGEVTIGNLLDEPLRTSLKHLQETMVNFFRYYSSASEPVEEHESDLNNIPLTVKRNCEELNKGVGTEMSSVSPVLSILDAYLKSAPLDCQNSHKERSTDGTGAVEDDFSISGREFLLVSAVLQSKYEFQCNETEKISMLHLDMLACDVSFSTKAFYQVGGAIVVALGLMTTSNQPQWCRLLSSTQHFLVFFAEKLVRKEGVVTFVQVAANSVLMSYSLCAPLCQKQNGADDANRLVLALAIIFSPIYSLSWNATNGTLLCDPVLEQLIWRIISMIIEDSEIHHLVNDAVVQQEPNYLVSHRKQTTLLEKLHEVLSNDWHQEVLIPLALFSFPTNKGCAKLPDDFTSSDEGLDERVGIATVTSSLASHPLFFHTRYLSECSFLSILFFFSQLSMILDVIRCQLQLLQTPLVSVHNYKSEQELIINALIFFDSVILPSFCLLSRLLHTKHNDAVTLHPLQHHLVEKELIENYLSSVVALFLEKRSYFFEHWNACQGASESSSMDAESNTVKFGTLQNRSQNVPEPSRKNKFIPQCSVEEWCRTAFLSKNDSEIQNEALFLRRVSADHTTERVSEEVKRGTESSSVMLERILPELLHLYKENEAYRNHMEELLNALSE